MIRRLWIVLAILLLAACVYRQPKRSKASAPTTDGLRIVPSPPASVDTNRQRR